MLFFVVKMLSAKIYFTFRVNFNLLAKRRMSRRDYRSSVVCGMFYEILKCKFILKLPTQLIWTDLVKICFDTKLL